MKFTRRAKPISLRHRRGFSLSLAHHLSPTSAPYMETSLFTCSANLRRTYSQPCLLRYEPLEDKDLPTTQEETHTSYLLIQSFTMYKNGQVRIRKFTTSVFYTKRFTPEGCQGTRQRQIQEENNAKFKKKQ